MSSKPIKILIVDDDEVDRQGIVRAFKKKKIINQIAECDNGKKALEILADMEGPYIVLLDVNMPVMNGFECLEKIRKDPKLSKIIVFMLTTSHADEDKNRAYNLHVNGYLSKSNVGENFVNLIEMIDGFWKIIEFPGNVNNFVSGGT